MNKQPSQTLEPFGAGPHERPVPRISIHAFCEFPDTGAALQRAGADRRLAKTHLNVQLGGIAAAVEYFQGQVTPNLLIVETRLGGREALFELDRLAEVCDAATKVVVIGRVNDVELYRELMRRGASEYLVAPLDPLHLIEVIASLYADPDRRPIGRVVTFMGARGGVGSSTLCHNVGWVIAEELGISTTIVDFDLPFGTVALNFNDEPGQSVADALATPERLDDMLLERILLKRGENLSLFAAPATIERDYEHGHDAYEAVIEAVRQYSPCVLVDLPHVWTPWVKATLIAADEIVLVASPDLASLRNVKNMIDLLKANRPNDALPRVVLNKVGVAKRPEIPVKDFAETIGGEPAVVVPYDASAFGQAANNGQMLAELGQKGEVVDRIRDFAGLITGRKPVAVPQKSFLSLFSAKKRA
ncbi:AAA family ATPase [Rhizomicrobium electricum]|uniref:Pilus assembly protein CpaE n=1 Tax=Rhizomicrobium electricum TaxID=480070 RepID=A0ABN1F4U9_9PROT|nr:cellulose synthase operon protein YhjQ/BcsQ [Rhizomicrobium electricum]NIJ49435.1 pilus assembly protein CpaE [Rhizomicrobium electricum]